MPTRCRAVRWSATVQTTWENEGAGVRLWEEIRRKKKKVGSDLLGEARNDAALVRGQWVHTPPKGVEQRDDLLVLVLGEPLVGVGGAGEVAL